VDTGHTVSRWGTLEKYERLSAFTQFQATFEKVFSVPLLENLLVDVGKVEIIVFGKLHLNDRF
jgi:hypothetical protein